jgi:hypothetical protein
VHHLLIIASLQFMMVLKQVLESVRQLRAPMSSRLSQFISAKGQHHQHAQPQRGIDAASSSSKNSEHIDVSLHLQPEQESVALSLCQKYHERLRMLFGSADAGEVVAESAAAALLKDFCASHGIESPPPSAFACLFRKYEPLPNTIQHRCESCTSHFVEPSQCTAQAWSSPWGYQLVQGYRIYLLGQVSWLLIVLSLLAACGGDFWFAERRAHRPS